MKAEADADWHIQGQCISESKQPVEGATVRARFFEARPADYGAFPSTSIDVRTDRDGGFTLAGFGSVVLLTAESAQGQTRYAVRLHNKEKPSRMVSVVLLLDGHGANR